MVYALQNELNMVRGEVMGWKQQQEMAENQKLLEEINSFSTKAEHFEEARPTMIQLLQSGVAQTLDEAYNKAVRLNEELFDKVQSARQAQVASKQSSELNKAAKAARAAAVSVRSATPGANTAPKAQGRRALLEEAFDEMGARL
jgi:transcriptional regulator of nitric oxide reductase